MSYQRDRKKKIMVSDPRVIFMWKGPELINNYFSLIMYFNKI